MTERVLAPVYKKMKKRVVDTGKQITIEGDDAKPAPRDRCNGKGAECAHYGRGFCTHRHWNSKRENWKGSCPYFTRRVPTAAEIDKEIKQGVTP